jgi:predicted nucleic acid-binding Zn ribbon protein
MYKTVEFQCTECKEIREELIDTSNPDELIEGCEHCNAPMERVLSSFATFNKIIPTYPGSQRRKAGYQHKHVNRPATKTQVGAGGSVSVDHPTGSTTNKD